MPDGRRRRFAALRWSVLGPLTVCAIACRTSDMTLVWACIPTLGAATLLSDALRESPGDIRHRAHGDEGLVAGTDVDVEVILGTGPEVADEALRME